MDCFNDDRELYRSERITGNDRPVAGPRGVPINDKATRLNSRDLVIAKASTLRRW
jgi:hypothetical protein